MTPLTVTSLRDSKATGKLGVQKGAIREEQPMKLCVLPIVSETKSNTAIRFPWTSVKTVPGMLIPPGMLGPPG
jgi:hypothetical protein